MVYNIWAKGVDVIKASSLSPATTTKGTDLASGTFSGKPHIYDERLTPALLVGRTWEGSGFCHRYWMRQTLIK